MSDMNTILAELQRLEPSRLAALEPTFREFEASVTWRTSTRYEISAREYQPKAGAIVMRLLGLLQEIERC